MKLNEPIQPCVAELATSRPDIAITVTRNIDESFRWDGDSPDPARRGFNAYDVYVKAFAIRNGALYEASSSLGGSYFKRDEPTGDIHGYLPQMLQEAVAELDKILAIH